MKHDRVSFVEAKRIRGSFRGENSVRQLSHETRIFSTAPSHSLLGVLFGSA
jgi:hypothetical protein